MSTMRPILTKYFIIVILTIVAVLLMLTFIPILVHMAFAQEAPAPVTPTPVPTPTPTEPNPNFQYLPQKAAVTVYNPEIGIPANTQPLQVVPQVVPVQNQTASVGGLDIGSIVGYLAAIGSAGAYIKGHLVGKKTDKVEETTKEVAQTQVKQIGIQQGSLELQYENMPQKGNEITNREDIRLANVESLKEKALDTAAKA